MNAGRCVLRLEFVVLGATQEHEPPHFNAQLGHWEIVNCVVVPHPGLGKTTLLVKPADSGPADLNDVHVVSGKVGLPVECEELLDRPLLGTTEMHQLIIVPGIVGLRSNLCVDEAFVSKFRATSPHTMHVSIIGLANRIPRSMHVFSGSTR